MNRISIRIESDGFNQEQAQALAAFTATLKPTGERHFKDESQPVSCGILAEAPAQEQAEPEKKKRNRTPNKPEPTLVTEEVATPEEQAVANEVETASEEVAPEEDDDLMGDETTEAVAPTVTREMVRSKVSDKQAAHKDAIRAKLKDLGAENVTKLEDKHFGDFYAFLNKLA